MSDTDELTAPPTVLDAPEPEQATGRLRSALRRLRSPLTLVVLAVLLALLGGFWQWRAAGLRGAPAVTNQALVDTAATTQVLGDVSDDLNRVFSYSYTDTASTEQAASQVLTGAAAGQYKTLFAQVKANAAAQKLILTTRTVDAGVTSLSGDDATLLVFLDQSAQRGDTGTRSTSAAELAVTAHRTGAHWLITGLQAR